MKVKELIKALKNFNPETKVCVLDYKTNVDSDYGDGTPTQGLYFDIELGGLAGVCALSVNNKLDDEIITKNTYASKV